MTDEIEPMMVQLDYVEWRLALLEAFIHNKNLTQEAQQFIQQVETDGEEQ